MKIDKGKMTGSYFSKHLNPSGDFYVLEGSQGGSEVDWKFIYGTGKFKGITGAGKSIRLTKGKASHSRDISILRKGNGNLRIGKINSKGRIGNGPALEVIFAVKGIQEIGDIW